MNEKEKVLVHKILRDLETIDLPLVDIRRQARRLRTLIFEKDETNDQR